MLGISFIDTVGECAKKSAWQYHGFHRGAVIIVGGCV